MKIFISVITTVLLNLNCMSVSGNDTIPDSINPVCFQFTWPGPRYDNTSQINIDCKKLSEPCFKPIVATPDSTPPNTTYMWHYENRTLVTCPMRNGYVCIKYSYIYNTAVLNSSYFCGKVIEDKTVAIDYGCYTQKRDGHTIEVCACKSNGGHIPCNSSPEICNSLNKLVVITFFIYLITDKLLLA
ncbi:uncharacterized protein LOC141525624 [Cotesia typhae]|uniref:uncharacterized protein LOC141525624 n=1 Tax=Cotesia typhae TaxID=2053667 RepID=UPI003D69DC89